MQPVEQYLNDIGTIRATQAGTGETSYYPALSALLNEIGKTLSPKVCCVFQLQDKGGRVYQVRKTGMRRPAAERCLFRAFRAPNGPHSPPKPAETPSRTPLSDRLTAPPGATT